MLTQQLSMWPSVTIYHYILIDQGVKKGKAHLMDRPLRLDPTHLNLCVEIQAIIYEKYQSV